MAILDIVKETTQQEILHELKAQSGLIGVIAKGYDIDGWDAAFELGRSGGADKFLSVGDQLIGKYTVGANEYSCPWDVVGFRDVVALVNGVEKTYKNAPIIQMHYAGHADVPFDPAETAEATEETAQEGFYYCGYDGTNYTMLDLAAGDSVPHGSYTKVYKSIYNSVNAIRYGNSEWRYSWMRQYLNNGAAGFAQAQHACDVLPANAASIAGFMSYIDAGLANNVHPIKIATRQASYTGGGLIYTFDKFFPLSVSEMNMASSVASPDDGEPLAYYQALLESETKKPNGTYEQLIKYNVANNTTARYVRLRSANLSSSSVWNVYAGGTVNSDTPYYSYRPAPACALV